MNHWNGLGVGLSVAIGIAGGAIAYDQYQKRKREQERFRRAVARLDERIADLTPIFARQNSHLIKQGDQTRELILQLVKKDEQVRALLREIIQLRDERDLALWHAQICA